MCTLDREHLGTFCVGMPMLPLLSPNQDCTCSAAFVLPPGPVSASLTEPLTCHLPGLRIWRTKILADQKQVIFEATFSNDLLSQPV